MQNSIVGYIYIIFMKVSQPQQQSIIQRIYKLTEACRQSRASIKNCSEESSKDEQLDQHSYQPTVRTRRFPFPLIQDASALHSLSSETLRIGHGYWLRVDRQNSILKFLLQCFDDKTLMTQLMIFIFLAQFLKHSLALAFGHLLQFKVVFKVCLFSIACNNL